MKNQVLKVAIVSLFFLFFVSEIDAFKVSHPPALSQQELETLLADLHSPDADTQIKAACRLMDADIQDIDETQYVNLLTSLIRLVEPNRAGLGAVQKRTKLRVCAIGAFGKHFRRMEPNYPKEIIDFVRSSAIPVLARTIYDESEKVSDYPEHLGPISVCQVSVHALGQVGHVVPEAIPILVDCMEKGMNDYPSYSANTRCPYDWHIPLALAEIGPPAKDAVPSLIRALNHDSFSYKVADALGAILDLDDEEEITSALGVGRNQGREMLIRLIEVVGELGASGATPYLMNILDDRKDADEMGAAIEALGNIGSSAKGVTRSLVEVLKYNPGEYQEFLTKVPYAIQAIGASDEEVFGVLTELIQDQENPHLPIVTQTIGVFQIAPQRKFDVLIASARADNPHAIDQLGELGTDAKGAIPFLLEVLADKGSEHRALAGYALIAIGGPDKVIVSALIDASKDGMESANNVLGKLGPGAEIAVPYLLSVIENYHLTIQHVEWKKHKETHRNEGGEIDFAKLDKEKREWQAIQKSIPHLGRFKYKHWYIHYVESAMSAAAFIDPANKQLYKLLKRSMSSEDERIKRLTEELLKTAEF